MMLHYYMIPCQKLDIELHLLNLDKAYLRTEHLALSKKFNPTKPRCYWDA
jgi:hypothetical protein